MGVKQRIGTREPDSSRSDQALFMRSLTRGDDFTEVTPNRAARRFMAKTAQKRLAQR